MEKQTSAPEYSAEPRASVVGLRAEWTCALCGKSTRTYQIVDLSLPVFDPPRDWRLLSHFSVCGGHEETLRREKPDAGVTE